MTGPGPTPGEDIAFVLEEVAAGRLVDALYGMDTAHRVHVHRAVLALLFKHVPEGVLLAEAERAARSL